MKKFGLLVVAMAVPALHFLQAQNTPDKLAPYYPTPQLVVDKMLQLVGLKAGETMFDLGSGDGRIVIMAAQKYKAKSIGVEISPKLVASATSDIEKAGLTGQARVMQGDVLKADLTGADVVTMYLETQLNAQLRPRLEKFLKPGARVVSHDYPVPGWKATRVEKIAGRQEHTIYLYEIR